MKLIVFGCQQIAVDFIKFIKTRPDFELPLVVTYELPLDISYGYESVPQFCKDNAIPFEEPQRLDASIISRIEQINPDIIFSIYYRKLFPKKLIDIPKLGCVNVHPSLLPEYRGPTPTAWAILNNESTIGVTIHYIDQGIDSGDILVQEQITIREYETGFELFNRSMELGAKLLVQHIDDIITQQLVPKKQSASGSYFGKFTQQNRIDWKTRTQNVINHIRVCSGPYGGAETLLFNKYFYIHRAKRHDNSNYITQKPGMIIEARNDGNLIISCADGCIETIEYDIYPPLNKNEVDTYLKPGNTFSNKLP